MPFRCLITAQEKQGHVLLPRCLPTKACTWYLQTCEEHDGDGLRKAGVTCCGHRGRPIHGGLLLPAHPTPLCRPTGTPCDHPSKSKKPSCGPFPSSPALPVNEGCVEDTNVEFCSQQDLDTHIEHFPCNLRTPYRVSSLREQTTLIFVFQWLLPSFCSLFWFGICSFPLLWGFQKLVDFLTFL